MASNEYHFITQWRIKSSCEEISSILGENAPDLMRWWPSVYLEVKVIEPGDAANRNLGQVVSLFTKGWLPYTLRWQFKVTEIRYPNGFTLKAFGDFEGRGIWTFTQDGKWVDITYDWKLRAEKPLLRTLSPLLKPFFKANHLWAMKMGEQSLQLELKRRHATNQVELAQIPPPPSPTTTSSLPLLAGGGVFLALLYLLTKRVAAVRQK